MPHYKDGTLAQLHDIVRGKPYNTPHEVIGAVVGITPGTDTCNMRVCFTTVRAPGAGDPLTAIQAIDYAECKAFEKVTVG
jgi:hypothetical protein